MASSKQFQVAIVGGGLGGLCLAICLHRHNVPFHIYEAAPSFGEIGLGVMCGPHAVNALNLISPDVLAAFREWATWNQDQTTWRWGTYRFGMDLKSNNGIKAGDIEWEVFPELHVQQLSDRLGTRTMSAVHRARFLDGLVKLVPEESATFNKALERLEQNAEGVTMYFEDGTQAHADAVVGCDGIKSKVRSSIMKSMGTSVEPKYVGEYCYRGLIDFEVAKSILGEELAGNANLWEGYGAYLVHYPVDKGKLLNVGAILRDTGPDEERSYERLIKPTSRERMYEDWKDWDPRLQRLLREFRSSDQWSIWDLLHDEKYFSGRVCIMGDAAHASTPHLGSGAGMAMEDAYILGNLLASVTRKSDLEAALAAFDAVRRPRTQQLIAKSREAGLKHDFMLPGVGDDLKALHEYSRDQYKWVFGFDLEKQLEEAKQLFQNS